MSLWRHAYVTLARCLCHHLRHAYVAKVRCLCRQSDIGMSPAPHQKRPVYRCSGRPFFVVFGHFRHEMRIFPASEACFGAAGEPMWPGAAGGSMWRGAPRSRKPPLFAHILRSLYTGDFSSAGGFVPAPSFLSSHGRHICWDHLRPTKPFRPLKNLPWHHPRSQPTRLPSPLQQDKNPIMGCILAGCNKNLYFF